MSSFTSPLVVSPLPDGRKWRLYRKFNYHIGSRYSRAIIKVPAGFVSDFASIPKMLWFLPNWAKYCKAPILHDWLYESKNIGGEPITRKTADDIFLEALLVEAQERQGGVILSWVEYLAVRLFAWLAWRRAG